MATKEIQEIMSGIDTVKEQLALIDFLNSERGLTQEQAAVVMLLILDEMEGRGNRIIDVPCSR